ncbi:MAG: hypothetical protein JSW00_12945 [Thermoplasmata archaeon]|nr:MAG: hypothetical protein JSW00_12945 [Thermoplasmata archaeon]
MTIGSTWAASQAPYTDGLIVEGWVGIGVTYPAEELEINGDILFDSGSARTIYVQTPSSDSVGYGLTVRGGNAFSGSPTGYQGGNLYLLGGAGAGGAGGNGGDVYIYGGSNPGSSDGDVIIAHTGSGHRGDVGIGDHTPDHKLEIRDSDITSGRAAIYVTQNGANPGTGYGIKVWKTGASDTNVAAEFVAADGTNNYGLLVGGDVGFGDYTPDHKVVINDIEWLQDGRAALEVSQSGGIYGTGYGIFCTKTGNSLKNIAGYFQASGGTEDIGIIVHGDYNGFGTDSPSPHMVEIRATSKNTDGRAALHVTDNTANYGTGYGIYCTRAGASPTNVAGYFSASGALTNNYGLIVDKGMAVFNEYGDDYDFRIESSNNVNMFFVDAAAQKIGIGTNGPLATLDVKGSLYVDNNAFGGTPTIDLAIGDTDTGMNSAADGELDIYSNNLKAMCIRGAKVGIGTTDPDYKLTIGDGTNERLHFSASIDPDDPPSGSVVIFFNGSDLIARNSSGTDVTIADF